MSVTVARNRITARKAHGCNDCGGRIEPGEVYVRSAVADGGEMWTWKEHADCRADADRMIALGWFDPADEWPGWESFAEMRTELQRRAEVEGRTCGAPDRGWEIHEPDDRMVIRCSEVES